MAPQLTKDEARSVVLRHTVVARPLLCPEVRLHLATSDQPLWRADERRAAEMGLHDPYWAFCWAGGHALARFLLDHAGFVEGKRVLDFGAGGGVEAIAAALRGGDVLASDIDPLATTAVEMNAALNGVTVRTTTANMLGADARDWDVVLAGDMTYEASLSAAVLAWFRTLASQGVTVLVADPQRGFLDPTGLTMLAQYDTPADDDADGTRLVPTTVFTLRQSL